MSRSRWAVLLGPPLILALATGAGSAAAGRTIPWVGTVAGLRAIGACPGAVLPPGHDRGGGGPASGARWRAVPMLDAAGALAGWTLTVDDGGGRTAALDLPPASLVSGPDRGRVVAAVDDGGRSTLRVLDAAAGCVRTIDLGEVVVRRAVADPGDSGYLVHLLARTDRADLGIWHVTADGRSSRVLGPVDDGTLRAAGIGRVWATNLAVSPDGQRLAVQSCDPDACLTRLLDRVTGRLTTLARDQGDLVGFAGERLVTMAACPGLPCGVASWRADGAGRSIADEAVGAAVARDGTVVIAVQRGDGGRDLVAVDAASGAHQALGNLADDAALVPTGGDFVGIETGPHAVGLIRGSGMPSTLEVQR